MLSLKVMYLVSKLNWHYAFASLYWHILLMLDDIVVFSLVFITDIRSTSFMFWGEMQGKAVLT